MQPSSGTIPRGREWALAIAAALALSVLMTWPLARGLDRLGRTSSADWQYSYWNVNWVARTLGVAPSQLYNANIFFPHRRTLAYSEANLVEGALAAPLYWLTRDPYVAYNVIVLLSFASAWLGAYLLGRRLTEDRAAAAVAAIFFACCPYVFSHTSHIQLMFTGGLPLAMLMFHRLADAPSPRRGAGLGLAIAAQALACAYYGIFAGLTVAYSTVFVAGTRRAWRERAYWTAVAVALATSVLCVLPFFIPYLEVQAESGFRRTIEDAARWSANPANYLASPAHAHAWLLALIARFPYRTEILFPGVLAVGFAIVGAIAALRATGRDARRREAAALYGSLGAIAFWASFGPSAGLYRVLYALPLFSFLRAPSRFGLVVIFSIAVLACYGVSAVLRRVPDRARVAAACALAALAIAELNVLPFPWERAPVVPAAYGVLAKLPRAPVAEFPFYGERIAYPLHAQYMMFSTSHWMPLVNGYSDVIPQDFRDTAFVLDSFPSTDAFRVLARKRVRYITIHWDMFGPRADEIRQRLRPFERYLRMLASDERMTLYDVVSFP